jgi:hypothetical protein
MPNAMPVKAPVVLKRRHGSARSSGPKFAEVADAASRPRALRRTGRGDRDAVDRDQLLTNVSLCTYFRRFRGLRGSGT